MTESRPTSTVAPASVPRGAKSFGGLLAAACFEAIGVLVLYYGVGPPVPLLPHFKQEAALRGAQTTPELEARLAAISDADDTNLAAHHRRVLIAVGTAALLFGLAFWARIQPLPASVAALCLYAATLMRATNLDFSVIVYDLVALSNAPEGCALLALSVLAFSMLVYAVLVSRVRRRRLIEGRYVDSV